MRPRRWLKIDDVLGRGWTREAIARFLRSPDKHEQKPRGRPTRLYATRRVNEVEQTREWMSWWCTNTRDGRLHAAMIAEQRAASDVPTTSAIRDDASGVIEVHRRPDLALEPHPSRT